MRKIYFATHKILPFKNGIGNIVLQTIQFESSCGFGYAVYMNKYNFITFSFHFGTAISYNTQLINSYYSFYIAGLTAFWRTPSYELNQ